MIKKSFLRIMGIFAVLTAFAISSCASSGTHQAKNILIERNERMFWEIKGEKGSIFVQGTIHQGADRLYPLDENVLNAFDTADKIYAEIAAGDLQEAINQTLPKTMGAMFAKKQKQAFPALNDEEKKALKDFVGAKIYVSIAMAEPWVIQTIIEELAFQSLKYEAAKGIDMFLYARAAESQKTVYGLDPVETQIALLDFGSYDDQMFMLKDTMSDIKNNTYKELIEQMFQLYCSDDRKGLAAFSETEYAEYPKDLVNRLNKAILFDRNANWVKTFEKLLDEGGNVFVFAGAGHFCGENNVFAMMKAKGLLREAE